MRPHVPHRQIDGVNVLLDDDVPRKRLAEVPVPQPALERRIGGYPLRDDDFTVIIDVPQHRFADIAAIEPRRGFLEDRPDARLKIHHKGQLPLGFPSAVRDALASRHVHRDRLGKEYVLARRHRRGGVVRVKVRRTLHHYRVEFRGH